jgi:predicted adenine nucleotide alpha hydrolase (AANH) superfamily ATPase
LRQYGCRGAKGTVAELPVSREGKPGLLLHSCCAPCGSHVIESLRAEYDITVYYYNPNIYPRAEYERRAAWQRILPGLLGLGGTVRVVEGAYEPEVFYSAVRGLEDSREGGARCRECFALRLRATARLAVARGYDAFTTTLSVSPHKDAGVINELGDALAPEYGVKYLRSDFKKRGGYQRSVELSRRLGVYRQRYCGCEFSVRK